MSALIGTEIRRVLSRRLVRAFGFVALVGILVAGPWVFLKSNRDVARATATARTEALHEYDRCLVDAGAKAALCEKPNLAEIVGEPRFHLTQLGDITQHVGAMLVMLGLIAGASFIGADWHHRVITTTLTWEPRRNRVLLAKVAAVAIVAFAGVVVYQCLLAGTLAPAAIFRGSTANATGSWFGSLVASVLRVGLGAAFAATVGSALAMIGRATAAALGGVFAWVAVGENLLRNGIPGWRRWLISENLGAFVTGGGSKFVRSASTAVLLLACYVLLVLAVAMRSFRRRDVA